MSFQITLGRMAGFEPFILLKVSTVTRNPLKKIARSTPVLGKKDGVSGSSQWLGWVHEFLPVAWSDGDDVTAREGGPKHHRPACAATSVL